ncbi:MAG: DUF1905 domain-containing protein [Candidatus Nanopelagicales bacterium]
MAANVEWNFDSELWLWRADAAWHFITLPHEVADEIEDIVVDRRGFGSIRVQAQIGASTWQTSIFPSKEESSFLLPIKKAVRVAEELEAGDACHVLIRLVEG